MSASPLTEEQLKQVDKRLEEHTKKTYPPIEGRDLPQLWSLLRLMNDKMTFNQNALLLLMKDRGIEPPQWPEIVKKED